MTQKLILADSIEKFCRNIDQKSSAVQYDRRLNNFDLFLREKYNVRIDEFLASFKVNSNPFGVYDVLADTAFPSGRPYNRTQWQPGLRL